MTDEALKVARNKHEVAQEELTRAERAYAEANGELSRLFMESMGIVPYRTVFLWKSVAYVAGISPGGEPVIWRAANDGRRAAGPNFPTYFDDWSEVTLTDRVTGRGVVGMDYDQGERQ